MVQRFCNNKNHCCSATFCPLIPAWARTIHKVQGLEAGLKANGEWCNIRRIIGDPGSDQFEKNTPGLFYTLLSRAISIGSLQGQKDSALYFCGSNMSESRVMSLSTNKDGKTSLAVKKREIWVDYLNDRARIWREENKKYSVDNAIEQIKYKLQQHKSLNLGQIIENYVQRLINEKTEMQEPTPSYSEWIKRHKKNSAHINETIDNITVSVNTENHRSEGLSNKNDKNTTKTATDELYEATNDSFIQSMMNYDVYPDESISTDGIHGIPDTILQYAHDIRDVDTNGSCAYYAIQEGLRQCGIEFNENMNEFRKCIYKYLDNHNLDEIFSGHQVGFTKRAAMNKIWNEKVEFEYNICPKSYWFDTALILPIITKMFNVNCICYSTDKNQIPTYATTNSNNQLLLHIDYETHLEPTKIIKYSPNKKTIALVHKNKNHYMHMTIRE